MTEIEKAYEPYKKEALFLLKNWHNVNIINLLW